MSRLARGTTLLPAAIAMLWFSYAGAALDERTFHARTTDDFIALCSAPGDEPLRVQAEHFCQGFLAGAFQYHEAVAAGPNGPRVTCLPDPRPTRDEAVERFVAWARAHPRYGSDPPVETLFRFAAQQWPCRSAARRSR